MRELRADVREQGSTLEEIGVNVKKFADVAEDYLNSETRIRALLKALRAKGIELNEEEILSPHKA